MNASLKQSTPPTAEQLRTAIEALESMLREQKLANSTARSAIAFHKASGDESLLQECRREIASTGKKIAEFETALAEEQAALVELRARAYNEFNGHRYKTVADLGIVLEKTSGACEEAANTLAARYEQARAAAAAFESELTRCNVSFDPYLSFARGLDSRIEVALWAASDGSLGRCRTMETAEQVRISGRASLRTAAREWRELCLSGARAILGLR
jgi:chromosome segregation ATPase